VFWGVFGSGLAHFQCCQKALSMLPKETFTAKNNFKEEGVIALCLLLPDVLLWQGVALVLLCFGCVRVGFKVSYYVAT
jgi:hypothetical protein